MKRGDATNFLGAWNMIQRRHIYPFSKVRSRQGRHGTVSIVTKWVLGLERTQ